MAGDKYIETLVELSAFIGKLNAEIYSHNEVLPGTIFWPFELWTNGEDIFVSFMDQKIYDIENYDSFDFLVVEKAILEEANNCLQSIQMMKIKEV